MSLTPEALKRRSRGLGGSDIGAMLGLSKWKTPVQLWSEKCGFTEQEDIGDKDIIIFGNLLEDIVANEFARRLDKKVQRRNKTVTHPKHDFMLANIDRWVVGERAVLEVKTAGAWVQQQWGETGTDDIPLYYLTQCVHYMAVLNVDVSYCAVLIGGNEFRWYQINRDLDIEASLIEKESQFWRSVLAQEPPDPMVFSDLVTLYPKDTKTGIVATDRVFKLLGDLETVNAEEKNIQYKQERLKMEICEFMGNAGRLTDRAGTKLATWLQHMRDSVDLKGLKRDYPEIYSAYVREVPVRPFRT